MLPAALVDQVLAHHPVPVADAVAALVAADGPFERRDRVVEVFRAVLRLLAATALAARVQYGAGPGPDGPQVPELLRGLRARGLTDGQWMALLREVLRPWEKAAASHALPELVTAVHGRNADLPKLCDALLVMRKSETVAHGASGTREALEAILAKREPQLARILEILDPLWRRVRLVLPLASEEEGRQAAWLLAGDTPPRGRWRRTELAAGPRLAPGNAVLVDEAGAAVLALAPILLVLPPSPDAAHEVFVLDGSTRRGALYVAFPSMAEHREADAWKLLDAAVGDAPPPSEPGEAAGADRPWRGLASFGPEHAALFFGREDQTESLANRIRRHSLITVTGPSGAGKSSLLCGGVLPQMPGWRAVVARPGSEPLENLAMRLAEAMSATEDELLSKLRDDPRALGPLLSQWGRETGSRLVLVIDQTEELFTLCHDEAQREAFAIAIASAESDVEGPIRVVLGVREDFFGRLATLAPLRGLYSRQVEVVTTPDREALGRTLIGPARHFGYAFEDEQLLVAMVDAVAGEPAALALLSFCADRLWDARDRAWKRLTWRAYEALGGVAGALASHADRVIAELTSAQRSACRAMLLRLVTVERTRAVVPRAELCEGSGDTADAVAVLDRLVAARLLTVGDADEGARVELVHEALVRHWGQLVRWLDEDVEGQRIAQALRQAGKEWDARGRAPDLLWRGDVLEELRLWRKRAAPMLTGLEAAFAEASEAEERRGRRIRRSLVAGAIAATAAFAAFLFIQWRAAVEAREAMAEARTSAEIRGLVSEARTEEPKSHDGRAIALVRAAAALEAEAGQRATTLVEADLERLARSGAASRALAGHTAPVWRLAVSPDRRRLLTASLDGTARIWDLATGKAERVLEGHGSGALTGAWTPDGSFVITGSGSPKEDVGEARVWDAATGAVVATLGGHKKPVRLVAVAERGGAVATASVDPTVQIWRLPGATRTFTVETSDSPSALAFSHDGKRLAIVGGKSAGLIDVETGRALHVLDDGVATEPAVQAQQANAPSPRAVLVVAFSPDDTTIATGEADGKVRLFEAATGRSIAVLEGHTKSIGRVVFSADGKRLASASEDGTARIWALDGAQPPGWPVVHRKGVPDPARPTLILKGHQGEVADVVFSDDGARVATAGYDMTSRVFDVATGAVIALLRGHEGNITGVAWLGDRIVTGSSDKTARIWSLDGASLASMTVAKGEPVGHLAFSRDGARLAVGGRDHAVRIVDVGSGAAVELREPKPALRALAFSPDGLRLATASQTQPPRLWDTRTGEVVLALEGHDKPVNAVAFSADGARIATASADGTARIWSATGQLQKKLEGHTANVAAAVFSPDGKRLATGSWDKTARIWDVEAGTSIATLEGHDGWVGEVAWSPDGQRLATISNVDGKLWDAAGKEIAALHGHEDAVMAIAFAPKGDRLATASADGSVRLWKASTGAFERTLPIRGAVVAIAFSPEGDRLAGAATEMGALWDVATGGLLDTWIGHPGSVIEVAFSPRGDLAATGATDGFVGLWRASAPDRKRALEATGAATNLRVCRATFDVVPLLPFPDPASVWAPDAACGRH